MYAQDARKNFNWWMEKLVWLLARAHVKLLVWTSTAAVGFGSPQTCRPSFYSTIFKTACPRAYSYAYDDGSSTFTCKAYDYSLTFCPTVSGSVSTLS